jgi:hypothetical protein
VGFSGRVIAPAERYVRHLCDNQIATMIPIRLTAIVSMVFAAMCLWFAIDAFTSLADSTDPEQVSGGGSFAWFWSFLAGAGLAIAWLSWRFAQTQTGDKDA